MLFSFAIDTGEDTTESFGGDIMEEVNSLCNAYFRTDTLDMMTVDVQVGNMQLSADVQVVDGKWVCQRINLPKPPTTQQPSNVTVQ